MVKQERKKMVSSERNVKTRYERDWGSTFFSLSPLHKARTQFYTLQ